MTVSNATLDPFDALMGLPLPILIVALTPLLFGFHFCHSCLCTVAREERSVSAWWIATLMISGLLFGGAAGPLLLSIILKFLSFMPA
jgi:hypothetical protein